MPSLSQSPILQALGYAIANSLWQMAMVWIVYVLLNSLFKFRSEIKYRIAVAAQVTGFCWFLVTLQFYYQQCSQALELAEAFSLQQGEPVVLASEQGSLLSYFIKAEQILPYLSVAYLLLLAFLTIRWFRAYRYTQLVRLNGLHKIDVDWKLFVTRVAAQLGIKQKVRIYLSELVHSPVTIGFLKPVILVPIASINHLSAPQLEAVILHELAHIRRHDYVLNILLSIIEIGLFFNPFTRLITKSVSKERENSCDDWVLQYQYNPSMYAEALLRIAVLQKAPAMAMYAVKSRGELLSRVQRMVHQKDSRFNYRHQLLALLLMTGILSSIAWFDPTALKNQDAGLGATEPAIVLQPLAAKVDNPLINPLSFLNASLKEEVKRTVAANQKNIQRTRRQLATANREIILPQVMAPVAIGNLKDLEKNIVSINNNVRKSLFKLPSVLKLAQHQAWVADSMKVGMNATYFNNDNFLNMAEELRKSQQSIEDAWRKGTITKTEAKKIQAEIAEALRTLKEIQVPQQFYGFSTGAGEGTRVFYQPALVATQLETERERGRVADEKRRANANETRVNKNRKEAMDSLKARYIAQTHTRIAYPHPPEAHTYTLAEGSRFVVEQGQTVGIKRTAPVTVKPRLLQPNGRTSNSYTYVYEESEDECEKANQLEKSRRVTVINGAAGGKIRLVPTTRGGKPAVVVKEGCTTSAPTPKPAKYKTKDAEPEIVEIELDLN